MKQFLMTKQSVILNNKKRKSGWNKIRLKLNQKYISLTIHFLPPLKSVKVNSVQNIGQNFERKLKR